MARIERLLSGSVRTLYIFLFLCVAALSLYSLCDLYFIYRQAAQKSGRAGHAQSRQEETRTSWPDGCVARIRIDDTDIDYPVMQAADNTTYLNLDESGAYSLSGSIFLDCRCDPAFRDGYSLIYGHHMEHGLMFGALDKFRKEPYFKSHRKGTLELRSGENCTLETFAILEAEQDCAEIYKIPCEYEMKDKNGTDKSSESDSCAQLLGWIRKHALIFREPEKASSNSDSNDSADGKTLQILALSTCSGTQAQKREILFCVLQR